MTSYSEVTADDHDVAAFIAAHPKDVNLYALPVKMWVAREDGNIIALLMLSTRPYVAIDVIRADPNGRPFMRLMKLWKMAEAWLFKHNIPMICITINNTNAHFQSLIRRLGFTKVGDEFDDNGFPVETIYGKTFTKQQAA